MNGFIGWLSPYRRYIKLALCAVFVVCSYLFFSPQEIPVKISNADKLAHIMVFFSLSLLFFFSSELSRIRQIVLLFAYGITVEVIQHFISYRSGGFDDVLADGIGIVLFYLLTLIPHLIRRQKHSD